MCLCVFLHIYVSTLRSKALVVDDLSLIPILKQMDPLDNCNSFSTYTHVGFLNSENKVNVFL